MRTLARFTFLFLILAKVTAFHFPVIIQEDDLMLLIDRISKKIDSYPKYETWQATVVSTTTEMDKKWQPKKVTVVKKVLKVNKKEEIEEILEAKETKKGITKDITKKYIKEVEKRREKEERKRQKKKPKKKDENREKSLTLTQDELLPFNEERRKNYEFVRLEDSYIEDMPVYVIESRANIKDEKIWEGKYYILKDSYEIIKTELKPSKMPKHVKEFDMGMNFQVLPHGYFVLRKLKMRINGGIFIKHIRMTVEEEYSDYEIFD